MKIQVASVLAIASVVSIVGLANADESSVSASAAPDSGSATSDPNIDRGFVLPTAMTQPKGSFTYNNYELLLHGFTYGITDRVQVSATALSPITRDVPFYAMGSVKGQVISAGRVHVALQGNLGYGRLFDTGGIINDTDVVTFGGGALSSFCLSDDCSSLVSGSVTYQLATNGDDNRGHLVIYGASWVQRIGTRVKLLAEITSAAGRDEADGSYENAPGLLASYGVRFHNGNLAGDVGFVKPVLTADEDDTGFYLGIPFINFSYRW